MFSERLATLSKTLRVRLMLWNAGVVLLMVVLTLIGLREGVRYTLIHEMDERLLQDLYEVEIGIADLDLTAAEIRAAAAGRDAPAANALLNELDRKAHGHAQRGWFIQLLDKQGRELWASVNTPNTRPVMPNVANFVPVTVDGNRLIQNRSTAEGFAPVTVRIGASNEYLDRDMRRIDRLVMLVCLASIAIAVLAGYWLADRAIRPLMAIINTTSRLRPRQLDQRLPIRGSGDELDQLSRTINGLLDRIANYLGRRQDFLANSAHELRTPIAAIRSTAEVALGTPRSNEEYEELLEEVIEECGSLELLVNQLLLLAETETDRLSALGSRVNLTEIIENSVDMFDGVAEFRGITLTADALPTVFVEGTPHHYRQVLNNLIDNAMKFTPRGGRVNVELTIDADSQEAVLRIRDNGIGIPAEDLPHIFERFFRGDRSRSRESETRGTGLGLSICQAVVENHGGAISVESRPGQGTTFTVRLSIAANEPTPANEILANSY